MEVVQRKMEMHLTPVSSVSVPGIQKDKLITTKYVVKKTSDSETAATQKFSILLKTHFAGY